MFCSPLPTDRVIAVDTECTGLNPWKGDRPFGIGLCGSNCIAYTDWSVDPYTREVTPDERDLKFLREALGNPDREYVFHNAKFDVRMLAAFGVEVKGKIHDTSFMSHAVNSGLRSHKLKFLADLYLQIDNEDEKDLQRATVDARRKGKKLGYALHETVGGDYWIVKHLNPTNELCEKYCKLDCVRTLGLYQLFVLLMKDLGVWEYYSQEMALWPCIYEMEQRGVRVRSGVCFKEIKHHTRLIEQATKKVQDFAGKTFNQNSTKQLCELLFERLELPVYKRTDKSGQPATDEDVLKRLSDLHPIVYEIRKVKVSSKARDTFFKKYLQMMVPDAKEACWVLHPDFRQCGARTGRLSCADPNLQQVPTFASGKERALVDVLARKAFGPRKGYQWYLFDYKQIELRVFADLGGPYLQDMFDEFMSGADIHSAVANKAWGSDIRNALEVLEFDRDDSERSEVVKKLIEDLHSPEKTAWGSPEDMAEYWLNSFKGDIVAAEKSIGKESTRALAKIINFLIIYGGGADALSVQIKKPVEECRIYLANYFGTYPGIKPFGYSVMKDAKQAGCIWTTHGKRIAVDRGYEYRAVNYLIQGSAAGFLKRSMLRVYEYLKGIGLDARIIMSIHDEIVIEIKEEHCRRSLIKQVKSIMEDSEGKFRIPTPVDVERVKRHWLEKEKIEWLTDR